MAHVGYLGQHSADPDLASHVMHDYTRADLDPQTRGMLDYAAKLTRDPASIIIVCHGPPGTGSVISALLGG